MGKWRESPHPAETSPWDREGVTEDAKRMASEGFSSSVIAKTLNLKHQTQFTRSAVIGKLHRLGVSLGTNHGGKSAKIPPKYKASPPWTKSEIDTMTQHSAFGADALSRLLKRSAKAIYRKASDMGIKLGGPKLARDDKPRTPKTDYVSPFPARPVMTCEEHLDGVPLLKAGRRQCRSVLGFSDGDYVFCGKPTVSDTSSWCEGHAAIYIQPVKGTKEDRNLKRSFTYHGNKGSEPRQW